MRKLKKLSSKEIRKVFLDFFESKGHHVLPGVSLIPDDPQLLFTIAGMVPFKRILWGLEEPKHKRVATVQKCIRTNDIENVGKTPRHHTFFEMLGNFSFGSYFKREAIEYAWEFLIERLEIPEDRLWVSIYKDDDEAYDIWTKVIGFDPQKVIRMGKKDNFWGPAGPSGPCGPDSEIFYDLRIPVKECPDPEKCTPACDCDRFLEIWNLVFTGLYQDENGKIGELEHKNIDTGMGLERLASVLQGVENDFDTDLFMPMIQRAQNMFNIEYGKDQKADISMRVIADHIRAATFLIADGVFPSNTERGYVLRRLIRRAVMNGKLFNVNEPFLYKFVDTVNDVMGDFYPEIPDKLDFIKTTVKSEEERFFKTLDQGLRMIEKNISNSSEISAEDAFKLYDTYGIPIDIILDIAQERDVKVDVDGFNSLMEKQRERARRSRGNKSFVNDVYESLAGLRTEFLGYDNSLSSNATVMAIISEDEAVESLSEGGEGEVIFDKTPFYAEKGGQIGDTGLCEFEGGSAKILNTYMKESLHVHKIKVTSGTLKVRADVKLTVNFERRKAITRNHTATHLLHAALRKVLGEHVKQAGSLVEDDKLRFDFTHTSALSREQLKKVEDTVNSYIFKNIPVVTRVMSLAEAKKTGAIALFGEKYGDEVRVVSVNDFSMELCGGTHVANTGEIGSFFITEEHAIAAGVRRIEAITGWSVLRLLEDSRSRIFRISKILETPEDNIEHRIKALLKENGELRNENTSMKRKSILNALKDEVKRSKESGRTFVIFEVPGISLSEMRNLADSATNMIENGVSVMINTNDGKTSFVVKSKDPNIKAKEIAKAIAESFHGKGGGRDEMAQGGWVGKSDIDKIKKIVEKFVP